MIDQNHAELNMRGGSGSRVPSIKVAENNAELIPADARKWAVAVAGLLNVHRDVKASNVLIKMCM